MTPRSLLAVAPDASRTGAPRLLASLLTELRSRGALDPRRTRILLGVGGPMEGELRRSATVRLLPRVSGLAGAIGARVHPGARDLSLRIGVDLGLMAHPVKDPGRPDLRWANGSAAARMAHALPRSARIAPLVAHVHELEIGLRRSLDGSDPRVVLDRADVLIAVSDAVAAHLVDGLGLDADRVAVHRGWVPGLREDAPADVVPRRPTGVPDGALVVGACGSIGWRKGTDLFLDLAAALPDEVDGRPVHLVWVGGPARPGDDRRTAADIGLRGLERRVHLTGEVTDAAPWLAGFDLLAHPAREDPFPLTVVEAGALGVPVVGYRSGGIVEAIPDEDHEACLTPLFDLDGLAERVLALLGDAAQREQRGTSLHARVHEHHRPGPSVTALWADVSARLGW